MLARVWAFEELHSTSTVLLSHVVRTWQAMQSYDDMHLAGCEAAGRHPWGNDEQ